jgi:hypothetical protein
MSRIYKHGHYLSDLTKDNIDKIVDVVETYLCNYKLAFHLVYQRNHLIRMDIYKLNSKSLMASYSFKFNTLSVFKRKVLQGVVSLEQMKQENANRGYFYDEWY